jgi:aminopeptidase YwaD
LTPKRFPFYQVDDHARLLDTLETARPLAVVAVTGACPEMAGAVRPFPFIEDGDFLIPVSHVDIDDAGLLLRSEAAEVHISLNGQRESARACNVVASRGDRSGRVVIAAHVDTKVGTPGALDNAAGVTVALLVGQMLPSRQELGVELLLVNGEDYFNAAGEVDHLTLCGDDLSDVALAVNVNGAGYRRGRTAFSLYGCDDGLAATARRILCAQGLIEGPQWWQSDHTLFAMRSRPAIALTSELQDEVLGQVVHSPCDTLDKVDTGLLVEAARATCQLIAALAGTRNAPLTLLNPGGSHRVRP